MGRAQNLGRIHVAAFSDETLHMEIANKAAFWTSPNYYGVNLQVLHKPAMQGYFSQVTHFLPLCHLHRLS